MHMPGSVQDYGVLVVADPQTRRVLFVSENAASLLNIPPADIVNKSYLARADHERERRLIADQFSPDTILFPSPLRMTIKGREYDAVFHSHGSDHQIEIEPVTADAGAHVETFDVPGRLSVLHVRVFPHLDDPTPIFGFDMVAGSARVTGIFLDLSPVGNWPSAPRLSGVCDPQALAGFAMRRSPPEWVGRYLLGRSAGRAPGQSGRSREGDRSGDGGARRTAQRRNEHTLRMLAGFIGHTAARRFIDEVLFPAADSAGLEPI